MTPTKLSIIIPSWNRQDSIARAVSSVGDQSHQNVELIVVDDGSTDETVSVAKATISDLGWPNARVIRQQNQGPGAARNTGAAEANGEYLAFLDSDDYWFPWTLNYILAALQNPPQAALIFLQTVDLHGQESAPATSPPPPENKIFPGFLEAVTARAPLRFASCNVIVRSDVFHELNGFTTSTHCAEDTDLFMRATRMGPCITMIGTPLVAHILGRHDNLTGDFAKVRAGARYILSQERAGAYNEAVSGSGFKKKLLSMVVASTVLAAFANGHPVTAYKLFIQYMGLLVQGRNWHWLFRLPLIPLLAALRPSHFTMRWRPD